MKKAFLSILFIVGLLQVGFSQNLPKPMNPPRLVNDFAQFFSSTEQKTLETKLLNYHDTTSNQIYVVTLADLQGDAISDFAFKLGDAWGIGQKGKDNGILILITPKTESNGKGEVFIATGYGMEGAVPDALCKRIVERDILPAFRQGQYYQGIDEATTTIIKLAAGEYTADDLEGGSGAALFGIAAIILLVVILIAVSRKDGGDHFDGGTRDRSTSAFPFFGVGGALGGFGGFSSGGGGFGGGFGGGGGGSFGGGGAGGSW